MTIIFEKLSRAFNKLRPDTVNKSPWLLTTEGIATLPRPLDLAIRARDHASVQKLLDLGAKPNLNTHFSGPALNEAVRIQDLSMVQRVVRGGGDVDGANKAGSTPLHEAAALYDRHAAVLIAEFLLGKGARLDLKNDMGFTPAEWARELGNQPVFDCLQAAARQRAVDVSRHAPKPPRA